MKTMTRSGISFGSTIQIKSKSGWPMRVRKETGSETSASPHQNGSSPRRLPQIEATRNLRNTFGLKQVRYLPYGQRIKSLYRRALRLR
jgi:hypothetical protein